MREFQWTVVSVLVFASAISISLFTATAGARAETCETAVDVGTIPPDYTEPGIAASVEPRWRSFTLAAPRKVRITLAGASSSSFVEVFRPCDVPIAWWYLVPTDFCLEPGRYGLAFGVNATATLTIHDLGPCFPPPKLVVRVSRIVEVNGDGDGYPDTGETVDVHLRIANKSPYTQ
jgi:hypothetical protein